MKTPIFTRSGEFKFAERILNFCLKTVHLDPLPVKCTDPDLQVPVSQKTGIIDKVISDVCDVFLIPIGP